LHKNRFLYFFYSPTVLLYLMHTLEGHSGFLFLANEKFGIEDDYIWITI
jgi:hypothetical protein